MVRQAQSRGVASIIIQPCPTGSVLAGRQVGAFGYEAARKDVGAPGVSRQRALDGDEGRLQKVAGDGRSVYEYKSKEKYHKLLRERDAQVSSHQHAR